MSPKGREKPDHDKARAKCRRPIEPWEVPYLVAVGKRLQEMIKQARYRQTDLALASKISRSQLYNYRTGRNRPRSSTLLRIVTALAERLDADASDLHHELVELAGPALAPETAYPDRVNGRREKRHKHNLKKVEAHERYGPILHELRRTTHLKSGGTIDLRYGPHPRPFRPRKRGETPRRGAAASRSGGTR